MKKLIICIAFNLISLSIVSLSQHYQDEIHSLKQRVDSLEHELLYKKISDEVNTLNLRIENLKHSVYSTAIDLKFSIVTKAIDKKTARNIYMFMLESFEDYRNSLSQSSYVTRVGVENVLNSHNFSNHEINMLNSGVSLIDKGFMALDSSIDLLKSTIQLIK